MDQKLNETVTQYNVTGDKQEFMQNIGSLSIIAATLLNGTGMNNKM